MFKRKPKLDQFEAAEGGAEAIPAFAAGGKFTDQQDMWGKTAPMYAASSGAEAFPTIAHISGA